MKKTPSYVIAVFALCALMAGSVYARKWTSTAGSEIDAEFAGLRGTNVMLKIANGRTVTVPLSKLSAADQAYVKAQVGGGSSSSSSGASWPQWRGPSQTNVSDETGLLKEWPSGGPKKVWTYSDAGNGYSSFSVAEGKLFTLGTKGDDLVVIAVDANTGEEAWTKKVSTDDKGGYNAGWGHGPRSTPTYSDGKVYVLGPKGTLACLSAEDGSKEWDKDLGSDFGGRAGGWGFSESPLVDGDLVVIAPGGNRSPLVALDKNSGATKWTADIPNAGPAEYATVVAAEIDGKRQYIKLFQKLVAGVDAETGSLIWTSPWPDGRTAVIPTPIVSGNQIYITSGYGAGCKLFEVNGSETKDIWVNKEMKNHHGGVVKIGDYVYGFSDGPGLMCQSWDDGEMVWNQRGQNTSKGSIHAADGMLYCYNEGNGALTLATATPDGFEEKGNFVIDPQSSTRHPQGKFWSHPIVVGGKLYLRDQEHIVCYDVKG